MKAEADPLHMPGVHDTCPGQAVGDSPPATAAEHKQLSLRFLVLQVRMGGNLRRGSGDVKMNFPGLSTNSVQD